MRNWITLLMITTACTASPTVRITAPHDAGTTTNDDAATTTPPVLADASVPAPDDASVDAPDAAVCVALAGSCADNPCCAGTWCETNAYIETWRTCVPGLPDGESCSEDAMCANGHCRTDTFVCGEELCGAAGQSCFGVDFPCCAGLACDLPADSYGPGACAPVRGLGEACAGDVQCASGHCDAGQCAEAMPMGAATFARVYSEVLIRNGCTSGACHGAGAGGLRFTDEDSAFRALVGRLATSCAGSTRVSPSDPENSLLWRKIAPGVTTCGTKMPPSVGAVSPAAADLVRDWIAAGALR